VAVGAIVYALRARFRPRPAPSTGAKAPATEMSA
jgi:hypothetical protein